MSDWRTRKLGDLISLEYGDNLPVRDRSGSGYPVYGSAGKVGEHSDYSVPGPGIIVGRKGSAGEVSWEARDFWPIDTTYFVKPKVDLDLRWLFYALNRLPLDRLSGATGVPSLNRHDAYGVDIRVPPLPLQRRIADILDTIDRAIRKTEEVIAKLEQMKRGLLHDLLTRGIDENGELRDPVAHPEQFKETQLGLIPREWEVAEVGEKAGLQVGYAFKSDWYLDHGEFRALRGANVGIGTPDWGDVRFLPPEVAQEFRKFALAEGDILIAMDRPFVSDGFKLSRVRRVDLPALLVQRVGRFLPSGLLLRFLGAFLGSVHYQDHLKRAQVGMDIPHISKSQILSAPCPVPGIPEQRRIEVMLGKVDQLLEEEARIREELGRQLRAVSSDLLAGDLVSDAGQESGGYDDRRHE